MKNPIFLLLFALIAANIEIDLFLPSFPQMKNYFQVDDAAIEMVISLNFLGLSISGLLIGWISDIVGRRKMLTYGMALFAFSSVMCVFASSFPQLLLLRFLQGLGCGAPATISYAAICDLYTGEKATRIICAFNGVITGIAIGAPLLGVILEAQWGWRSNFILIAILASLSWLLICMFFQESLLKRRPRQAKALLTQAKELALVKSFWIYGLIAVLVYACIITFLANFSLLSIDYMHISSSTYGWLQAGLMLSFAVGSFVSVLILKWTRWSKGIGLLCLIFGSLLSFLATQMNLSLTFLIASVALFNFGAAFLIGIFSTLTIQSIKSSAGLASSAMGSLRIGLSALFIYLSGVYFDGTFKPLGIQFMLTGIAVTVLIWRSQSLPMPAEPDLLR